MKILCLTLLINTSVYASNTIRYNNGEITDFNTGATNYLTDRITELQSDNTKTYFDLRDIMKDANFSYEDNKIVTTFDQENETKYTTNKIVIIKEYGKSLDGYIYNEEQIDTNIDKNSIDKNNVVDGYDKILSLIDRQYIFSILNFKLNNKIKLNEVETNLVSIIDNIKTNSKGIRTWNPKWCSDDYEMIKHYASEPYEIPFSLYYDVREILKSGKVKNHADQLKLDIYKQVQDMKKYSTQYDEEFKVLHMYFINQFYRKNKIAYAYTNDGKEETLEITDKNRSSKNILKPATFTNKNHETTLQRTNFNFISTDKNDIPEEDQKDHVFTSINEKDITEVQIYTKHGMSNTNAHKIAELVPA